MPTNHDETLQQRYQREHAAYLESLAKMKPEQIAILERELHNVTAQRDALRAALERITTYPKSRAEECSHTGLRDIARAALSQCPGEPT